MQPRPQLQLNSRTFRRPVVVPLAFVAKRPSKVRVRVFVISFDDRVEIHDGFVQPAGPVASLAQLQSFGSFVVVVRQLPHHT